MTHSSSELADPAAGPQVAAEPGWAMAPTNAAAAGFVARGSWLLEPDTGTGMLLYPRDWSFTERRDVTAHLREQGWSVVPISRFLHLTSDGTTAIRLLGRRDEVAALADLAAEILTPRWATATTALTADVLEASI